MVKKCVFGRLLSLLPFALLCAGALCVPALADSSRRDGLGNSPANLSRITSQNGYSGWLTYDDESVYFFNGTNLYRAPLSGGNAEKLMSLSDYTSNESVTPASLNLYNDDLYFTDLFRIWRYDLDTGSCQALTPDSSYGYIQDVFLSDGALYYIHQGEGELWRMNPDGSGNSLVTKLNDASMLGDADRLDFHFQRQYAFSDGFLYYCTKDPTTADAAAMARIPLSGGEASIVAPARSDPAGGDFTPDPGTVIWEPFAPVPAGDWIYYLEDYTRKILWPNGGRTQYLSPIGGIWRMSPDGSRKELLYENYNRSILYSDDSLFGPVSNRKGISSYTVRDGIVFLVRTGSLRYSEYDTMIPDSIYKLETGAFSAIYSAPPATAETISHIVSIATVPGWVYFIQEDNLVTVTVNGNTTTYEYTPAATVYRMRFDGSELEYVVQ